VQTAAAPHRRPRRGAVGRGGDRRTPALKDASQHRDEVYVFAHPVVAGVVSKPGCVIASPSYAEHPAPVNQDYVFNWTRDAAITAMELAAAPIDTAEALGEYVRFARMCQSAASAPIHRACYRVDGEARNWSDQSDGPALRVIATLQAWSRLESAAQATAGEVVAADLGSVLAEYRNPTCSLWEEERGASFFARSVQLRCLSEVRANTFGLPVPPGVDEAIAWLQERLETDHWIAGRYASVLDPQPGYDLNTGPRPARGLLGLSEDVLAGDLADELGVVGAQCSCAFVQSSSSSWPMTTTPVDLLHRHIAGARERRGAISSPRAPPRARPCRRAARGSADGAGARRRSTP
jgi:hypothetical protein